MSKRLTITLPDELYTTLKNLATKERRSISNEVIYLLEDVMPTTTEEEYEKNPDWV